MRVDTVHQGDSAETKGVYHINAVDAVTQWQVVRCAEKISKAYLMPVLAAVFAQFLSDPRFSCRQRLEYINHKVAKCCGSCTPNSPRAELQSQEMHWWKARTVR